MAQISQELILDAILVERIEDGFDLRSEIERITRQNEVRAGSVLCGLGGLQKCRLRLPVTEPGQPKYINPGVVEIIALQGTLSLHSAHIHVAVSDEQGKVWGGHLSKGCIVRMTCELVIMKHSDYEFDRALDPVTGYDELVVSRRQM